MPNKILRMRTLLVGATLVLLAMGAAFAQPFGRSRRGEGSPGMMAGGGHSQDMAVFHFLLDHRADIRRVVKEVPGGVETTTESDVPEVATKIKEHVGAMYRRLKESRPIHARDPLFAAIFANAEKIDLKSEPTPKGLTVTETSRDPYVTQLIRSHAQVVSSFLKFGHSEMMKNHPVPGATAAIK